MAALVAPASAPAEQGIELRGSYESADRCFRVVAYEHQGAIQLILYGCIKIDTTVYRYVAQAQDIQTTHDGLYFELPPRQLSQIQELQSGIEGHQSELLPLPVNDTPTVWRLVTTPSSVVLDCVLDDPFVCGLAGSAVLFPTR